MTAPKSQRPPLKQETPAELVKSLMLTIREVYKIADSKEWYQKHQRHVREWCILWPARFIVKEKHFSLPADRFKAILVDIIVDSKRHATGPITYLPAFLGKCVQTHFRIHWEEYYEQSKSLNALAEAAIFAAKSVPQVDRAVEIIAAVELQQSFKPGPKKKKPEEKLAKPTDQPTLF